MGYWIARLVRRLLERLRVIPPSDGLTALERFVLDNYGPDPKPSPDLVELLRKYRQASAKASSPPP
jgi:hypothetical protein